MPRTTLLLVPWKTKPSNDVGPLPRISILIWALLTTVEVFTDEPGCE
jgi:hypothetical protein